MKITATLLVAAALLLVACGAAPTATTSGASSATSSPPPSSTAPSSTAPSSTAPSEVAPSETAEADDQFVMPGLICFTFQSDVPPPPGTTSIDAVTFRAWGRMMNKTANNARKSLPLYKALVDEADPADLEQERLALAGVQAMIKTGKMYGDTLEAVNAVTDENTAVFADALTAFTSAADQICPQLGVD